MSEQKNQKELLNIINERPCACWHIRKEYSFVNTLNKVYKILEDILLRIQ